MALGKWIGGFLGFMSGGPLGALAGIVMGSFFDKRITVIHTTETISEIPLKLSRADSAICFISSNTSPVPD